MYTETWGSASGQIPRPSWFQQLPGPVFPLHAGTRSQLLISDSLTSRCVSAPAKGEGEAGRFLSKDTATEAG